MKPLLEAVAKRVSRLSPAACLLIGLAWVLALGAASCLAPTHMVFTLYYLLGILLVGWGSGSRAALVVAAAATLAGALQEWFTTRHDTHVWVILWNACSRGFVYAITGLLTAEAARLTRNLASLVEDRTARWKAEAREHQATAAQLAEAVERFQQVTDSISEVFWLTSVSKDRMMFVSPAYERVWGRTREELMSSPQSWLESLHPEDRQEIRRRSLTEQAAGQYEVEYRIVRPDGEVRWIRDRAFPVRNAQGEIERIAGVSEDITQRKRDEAVLRDREERLRLGLDAAHMVTWDYDIERGAIRYSENIAELVGGDATDPYCSLEGVLLEIHAEDRDRVRQALKRAEAPGAVFEQEYRARMLDGSERWIYAKGSAVRDKAGVATRILGISMDISERRRLESQILEINDRAHAHVGQELHDGLCQELVSLAFDANALQNELARHQRPEAALAGRIAGLLDRVITEARQLSRGLFPIRLETGGLASALQELTASLRERFQADCACQIPESVEVPNRAVATHLYRIAQEALNNALKHSRASRVRLRLRQRDGQLEMSVSDNGVGLARETPDSLTGMGLHIMDYRARAVGGVLCIEPRPQGGTVVTCHVPNPRA